VLFSGTVRSNLDPFNSCTDGELFEALARVQLIDSPSDNNANGPASIFASNNANIFRDLSSPVSEFGGNLSQGQRQLLCIARSLLTSSKIIVLDEATSAVDVTTDTLIQRSIRDGFTDRTLIVIAHRLSTISDFDRILVLENGCMVEFGTPRELWEKKGAFRSMCDSTGDSERDSLRKTIFPG
jgi:ABC-type multidrug transport system fused ATPase/permease subunit